MPITREDLQKTIRAAFPSAQIKITDLAGDNDHWSVEVIDESFKNLSRLAQHKMVQSAVRWHEIHALQISTKTTG